MKNLKDYLHLYIGSARVEYDSSYMRDLTPSEYGIASHVADNVKLVLRPLSDMTQMEQLEYSRLAHCYLTPTAEAEMRKNGALTKYLISRGFDVFDLIVLGLAVDASETK